MIRARVRPQEVLIVEDSPIGQTAAINSGAHLLAISAPDELTLNLILSTIKEKEATMTTAAVPQSQKWRKPCTVLIPMSGAGSRFVEAGYTFPKPLIEVRGMPMIEMVVRNLGIDPETAQFVFVVRKDHYNKYDMEGVLQRIAPGCKIVQTDGLTQGAVCSCLLAKEFIDNDKPLVIANSDQFMEFNPCEFYYAMSAAGVDGGIAVFKSTHPKWSFCKLDHNGFVSEVAEKKVISNLATTGLYTFTRGSDFVKYAEQMIEKNIRVNNEFYLCPVFNEFIGDGKKIKVQEVKAMHGCGIPDDLKYFLQNYKGNI